jgi:hypothetical protein
MNATLAVMTRELGARRQVAAVAVAAAVIAAAMPLMPGLGNYQPDDVRTVSASTLALAVGWGLALLFGATIIGGDLSEGRFGFYFARPVSGLTVWWGRILAVLTLVLVCEAVVLIPSLFGQISDLTSSNDWWWPALVGYLVMPFLLLLLAHAVSIMARARTAWLFLDLSGAVVFAILAWVSLRPLLVIGTELALWVIAGALIAALLIALSVAGGAGVAIGRVDLPRAHGALSLALWATLAVLTAAITFYSGWLRHFGPADFDDVQVSTLAPDGRWVEAIGRSGRRLDVRRRCLVSITDKRWIPLPGVWGGYPEDVFYSADGTTALWRGPASSDEPRALWWADLGRRDPSARQTNLVVARDALLALSSAGDRLAILEEGTVSFYELEDEQLVTAVRLPEGFDHVTTLFPSEEILRLFVRVGNRDRQSLLIVNVVVSTGEIVPTGKVKEVKEKSVLIVDGGLKHMIVWTKSEDGLVSERNIYNANDGSFIRKLTSTGLPRFLQDGRLVMLSEGEEGTSRLVVESVEGDQRAVHSIDGRGQPRLSGEAVPNGVVISRLEDPSKRTQGLRIDVVDVDTGKIRTIGRHLRRAFSWLPWQYGSAGAVIWFRDQPGASRLFIDQTGALLRWNPDTGGLAHVVGGAK